MRTRDGLRVRALAAAHGLLAALTVMFRDADEPNLLSPGARLGRYAIVRPLDVGGMGEIYLAEAVGLGGFAKRVALKRLRPELARSRQMRAMFLDEARIAASVVHANVASAYEIDEDNGNYFYTMEYVPGPDARVLMKRCASLHLRVPLEHAVKIGADVAAGLHAAHDTRRADGSPAGIVHRDASPSNVVIAFAGYVKLIDFGVARADSRLAHTRHGVVKGKLSYMSPEQCLGEPVDRRSDVFTLGVLLYELTTGKRPFEAHSEYALVQQVVAAQVVPPSQLVRDYPMELEDIVLHCLQRKAGARYQTAAHVQAELEHVAVVHGLPLLASGLGEFVTGVCRPRRKRATTIDEHIDRIGWQDLVG